MPVEGGSECGQVEVAVDAAELLAGLDRAGGAPHGHFHQHWRLSGLASVRVA